MIDGGGALMRALLGWIGPIGAALALLTVMPLLFRTVGPVGAAIAVAGAVAIEALFALNSSFAAAVDYRYGAPLEVGRCHHDFLLSPASGCSFDGVSLLVNVALAAAFLMLVGALWGRLSLALGGIGGFGGVFLSPRSDSGAVDLMLAQLIVAASAVLLGFIFGRGDRGAASVFPLLARLVREGPSLRR